MRDWEESRLFVALLIEMSSEKIPSEFWTKASMALQKAPELRSMARELRSSSQLLCARNFVTNLRASEIAARVFELSLRIEQSDNTIADTQPTIA